MTHVKKKANIQSVGQIVKSTATMFCAGITESWPKNMGYRYHMTDRPCWPYRYFIWRTGGMM